MNREEEMQLSEARDYIGSLDSEFLGDLEYYSAGLSDEEVLGLLQDCATRMAIVKSETYGAFPGALIVLPPEDLPLQLSPFEWYAICRNVDFELAPTQLILEDDWRLFEVIEGLKDAVVANFGYFIVLDLIGLGEILDYSRNNEDEDEGDFVVCHANKDKDEKIA